MPIIATAANAINFNNVKTLFTTVPHFVPMEFNAVTIHTTITPTSLSAHNGVVSFGFRERKRMRSIYSAKIMAIIAAEPGLNAVIAVQEKRKADRGPKIWYR